MTFERIPKVDEALFAEPLVRQIAKPPYPLAAGSTTAGTRQVPAGSTNTVELVQLRLAADCPPLAWRIAYQILPAPVAGEFILLTGDDFGRVEFRATVAIGQTSGVETVPGKYITIAYRPLAPSPTDFEVGVVCGLLSR